MIAQKVTSVEYLKSELVKIGNSEKFKQIWDLILWCDDIEEIRHRFSPKSFEFIQRAWELLRQEESEDFALDMAVSEQTAKHTTWRDDEVLDEVDAFAVVYGDRIEVTANEPGLGERIPKQNRKYVGGKGDMRWFFPLSEISAIVTCSSISFVLNEDGSLYKKGK
jgi:hypothetical protein